MIYLHAGSFLINFHHSSLSFNKFTKLLIKLIFIWSRSTINILKNILKNNGIIIEITIQELWNTREKTWLSFRIIKDGYLPCNRVRWVITAFHLFLFTFIVKESFLFKHGFHERELHFHYSNLEFFIRK